MGSPLDVEDFQRNVLAVASGHLGVEPPGEQAVRVARLPNAASSTMAAAFNRFVNITDLRLGARLSFRSELLPSLLKMPKLRRLVINTESGEDELQVRCPPRITL